jgi:hypothetical protein
VIGVVVSYADALDLDPIAQDEWCSAYIGEDSLPRVVRRVEITTDPVEAGLCASCERALDDDCDGPECACCAAEGLL